MNKFIFYLSVVVLSGMVFAQEAAPEATLVEPSAAEPAATEQTPVGMKPASEVGYEPNAPTDVRQAPGESKEYPDSAKPKRPTYNLSSIGLGASVWHNWESKKYNPKRDWDQGFVLHYGRIWEMGAYGAITFMNNTEFSLRDHWQWSEMSRIGGRVYFADAVFAPFFGMGIGLGFQLDGHYDDIDESFAVGFAGGIEVGITIFRTSQTQLEIGCSYDSVLDYMDFDRRFGSFNFYVAINY